MGCYDRKHHKWKTVTKVHTGHDDETLERLQKELEPNMCKIKGNFDRIPEWLDCTRQMSPDFVAKDPKLSPVWEITGAEFSKAEIPVISVQEVKEALESMDTNKSNVNNDIPA